MTFQKINRDLICTGVLERVSSDSRIRECRSYFNTQTNSVMLTTSHWEDNSLEFVEGETTTFSTTDNMEPDLATLAFGERIFHDYKNRDRGSWHEQTDRVSVFHYPQMNLVRIYYSQWIDNPLKKISNQTTIKNSFYTYSELDLELVLQLKQAGLLNF